MGPDSPVTPTETDTVKATDTVPVASSSDSGNKTTVRTVWPQGNFHIENVPTVTREGVQLSDAELETVRDAAKQNGVRLVEGTK